MLKRLLTLSIVMAMALSFMLPATQVSASGKRVLVVGHAATFQTNSVGLHLSNNLSSLGLTSVTGKIITDFGTLSTALSSVNGNFDIIVLDETVRSNATRSQVANVVRVARDAGIPCIVAINANTSRALVGTELQIRSPQNATALDNTHPILAGITYSGATANFSYGGDNGNNAHGRIANGANGVTGLTALAHLQGTVGTTLIHYSATGATFASADGGSIVLTKPIVTISTDDYRDLQTNANVKQIFANAVN